ncbi:dihydroxy-acid dehydratase [Alishewanella longhuensis]
MAVFRAGLRACLSGHVSPEAASGGTIALIAEGDRIEIDIPNRKIAVAVSDEELAVRRAAMQTKGAKAWKPENRQRVVSSALKAYALLASSADKGAVRDVSLLKD